MQSIIAQNFFLLLARAQDEGALSLSLSNISSEKYLLNADTKTSFF